MDNLHNRSSTAASMDDKADVIIIGGGASGIHAGSTLVQAGKSILLLESRDRLGGRIYSHQLSSSGTYVEYGAQWLAEKGQTRLESLAQQFNYTKIKTDMKGNAVVWKEDGRRLLRTGIWSLGVSFLGLVEAFWQGWRLSKISEKIAIDRPFYADMVKYDDMSVKTYLESNRCTTCRSRGQSLLYKLLLGGFNRDLSEISVYNYARVSRCIAPLSEAGEAEGYYFDEGLQPLFEKYASSFLDRIRLNTRITQVDTTHGSIVRVGASNGQWFEAKQVIIAMPPQLLEYIEFQPQLPRTIREVSSSMLQGQVMKLVAVFHTPWWKKYGYSGFINSELDVIAEVADLSHSNGNGVLAGFISGPNAQVYCDRSKAELTQLFSDLIKKSFGRMDEGIQELFYHNWIHDDCSLGGYASHVAAGKWQVLRDGAFLPSTGEGKVHFAGTEYAHRWRGYIEGAMDSGERAAKTVLSTLD